MIYHVRSFKETSWCLFFKSLTSICSIAYGCSLNFWSGIRSTSGIFVFFFCVCFVVGAFISFVADSSFSLFAALPDSMLFFFDFCGVVARLSQIAVRISCFLVVSPLFGKSKSIDWPSSLTSLALESLAASSSSSSISRRANEFLLQVLL